MILSIQYLRAVAALLVVLLHMTAKISLSPTQKLYAELGAAGVDVFFVISGFAMSLSTHDRPIGPWQFYANRIFRIVPLYWLITLAVIAVVAVAPGLAGSSRFDAEHAVASFFFLPWPHPGVENRLWPLLIPGWTLNYEMFFYLIVGLVLPLRQHGWAALGLIIISLVALGAIFDFGPRGQFYTSPLLLEFFAGFGLAYLFRSRVQVPLFICVIGFALALAGFALLGSTIDPSRWDRALRWGLPAILLVASALLFDKSRPLPDNLVGRLLGDASYSIYLVQFLCVPAVTLVWKMLRLPFDTVWGGAAFMLVGAITVCLIGILVHRLFEKPMLESMQALRARRSHSTRPTVRVK